MPFLRGHGTTVFLSSDTVRNGQPSAVALDTIALMDALRIDKAILAGFDWGARSVNIISALWPERCKATVSVSGYLIGSQEAGKDAASAQGRVRVVVPVLFRHRAWTAGLRQIPARIFEAYLGNRFTEVAVRRRHFQS